MASGLNEKAYYVYVCLEYGDAFEGLREWVNGRSFTPNATPDS